MWEGALGSRFRINGETEDEFTLMRLEGGVQGDSPTTVVEVFDQRYDVSVVDVSALGEDPIRITLSIVERTAG